MVRTARTLLQFMVVQLLLAAVMVGLFHAHTDMDTVGALSLYGGLALQVVAVMAMVWLLLRRITQRLNRLREGVVRVSEGDFGHQLEVEGHGDYALTIRTFNFMSTALAMYAEELTEARDVADKARGFAEATLHDAIESMMQGVMILAPDRTVTYMNGRMRAMYPDVPAIEPGQTDVSVVFAVTEPLRIRDNDKARDPVVARLAMLKEVAAHPFFQTRLKDDRVVMVSQRGMTNGGWVLMETDITEFDKAIQNSRRLELEMVQKQKMESLGTLAGGIAHEINTPVQYVGDNLRFLRTSITPVMALLEAGKNDPVLGPHLAPKLADMDWDFTAEELPQALDEALQGVEQVRRLVLSVKEFSYPETGVKVAHDLNHLVETTVTVSRNQWKYKAKVETAFDPDLPQVPCFPGELGQVVLNLLINAADAVAERHGDALGTIRLATRKVGEQAMLEVTDDGAGIPQDIMDRIFDLFFTTKDPGKGTGQGLAICRSIVETKHGGRIAVTSEEGVGTTFAVYLPLTV